MFIKEMLIDLNNEKQMKECFDEVMEGRFEPKRDIQGWIISGCQCEIVSELMSGFLVFYCKKCGKIERLDENENNAI